MFRFYTMQGNGAKPIRIAAWLVHALTASGAVLAFAGARAVWRGDVRGALAAMLAATVVDGIDGALARHFRVREALPEVDGGHIDDLVDYLTFVFLPMLLFDRVGGLPPALSFVAASAVLLSSAYGFAASDAKSPDHFFTGFPSYWNIVVLYLLLFHIPPVAAFVILFALTGLVFVRIGYVYPTRTPVLRRLTLWLAAVWASSIAAIVALWPSPPLALSVGSLAFPVYYLVLSLVLQARRGRMPPA